jgi:hypothetical protein
MGVQKETRPDDTIEKYKARLVAKGTYSPVARLTTIRVLLSFAASPWSSHSSNGC